MTVNFHVVVYVPCGKRFEYRIVCRPFAPTSTIAHSRRSAGVPFDVGKPAIQRSLVPKLLRLTFWPSIHNPHDRFFQAASTIFRDSPQIPYPMNSRFDGGGTARHERTRFPGVRTMGSQNPSANSAASVSRTTPWTTNMPLTRVPGSML